MRYTALALALLATPALAQEAVTLAPGHPDLTLPGAPPEGGTTDVRMVEPEDQSLGTVEESVTLEGDVLTIVRRTVVPAANANSVDSTRLAWPSLVPLSHDVVDGEDAGAASYADGRVTGTYDNGRGALPFEFDLEDAVFAPSALGIIVRSIPLEPGYTAVVPTFSAEDRFKEVRLSVTGPEDVEHEGATVSAWVVEQRGGGGLTGPFAVRHLVDAETRELLYSEFRPQDNLLVHLVPLTAEEVAAREAEAEAAAAAAEAARAAAAALRPGAEALATDALRSYSVEAAIRLVEPMEQDAGTDTRTLTVDEAAGTLTLAQVVDIALAGQRQEITVVASYPSLAPISISQSDGTSTTELAFADGRVTGTHDGEPVDVALEAPVFASGLLAEVVRLLPFADGYSATFHAYSAEDGVVETLLTVTGQEDVGGRTAWVVTAEREGNPTFTFRVDAETRDLISYGFSPQPGARIEIGAAE